MLDDNFKVYLIEANTNPCLEESNALLKTILPRMVDDMLNIVMDPLFAADGGAKYKSCFKLPGVAFGVNDH